MRGKLPLVLSAMALIVALGATTGPAVAHGVRHALFAHNAGKVDGKSAVGAGASTSARRGRIVATRWSTGRLPNNIIAKAPDANLLDGLDSAAFLGSAPGAVTTDKLADGAVTIPKLAPEAGLGFFTGRLNDVDAFSVGSGPASGMSQAASSALGVQTLSPDREIRMRELAATLTTTVSSATRAVLVNLNVFEPDGTFITQLFCNIDEGESECTDAGPSGVIPPRSFLVLQVGALLDPPPPGTDLLFSWRAQAP